MKKTIMIVDDEKDVRETVKSILTKHGFATITAVDGDDCLKKLQRTTPDLILLDIMMPGTPVKEVAKQIKGVKIAFLSVVLTSDAEREELLSDGQVVDYIQKPFEINDLVRRVKKLVAQ